LIICGLALVLSSQGGETEALSRLAQQLSDKQVCLHSNAQHVQAMHLSAERDRDVICHVQWVADFEKPKGNPALFDPPATTVGAVLGQNSHDHNVASV
jgi:hypothetical protein